MTFGARHSTNDDFISTTLLNNKTNIIQFILRSLEIDFHLNLTRPITGISFKPTSKTFCSIEGKKIKLKNSQNNSIMSDDEETFNQSFFECEIRKQKYKRLLNYGQEAAEKVETSSFADNMSVFTELVIESNKLCDEGEPADRCGQSGEIVLDAQVCVVYA